MIRPLGEKLLVDRFEAAAQTPGGIIIVENTKQIPCEGTVIAAGNGKLTKSGVVVPNECKVGDKVMFSKYSGVTVKFEEKEYLMINDSDILAIKDSLEG